MKHTTHQDIDSILRENAELRERAEKAETALKEIRPHLLGSRLLHIRHIIDRALGSMPNAQGEPRR